MRWPHRLLIHTIRGSRRDQQMNGLNWSCVCVRASCIHEIINKNPTTKNKIIIKTRISFNHLRILRLTRIPISKWPHNAFWYSASERDQFQLCCSFHTEVRVQRMQTNIKRNLMCGSVVRMCVCVASLNRYISASDAFKNPCELSGIECIHAVGASSLVPEYVCIYNSSVLRCAMHSMLTSLHHPTAARSWVGMKCSYFRYEYVFA